MDNSTDNFIANAGKATQKPEVFYDAVSGKRHHQGDELNINAVSVVNWGVGIISFCLFCVAIYRGWL